MAKRQPEVIRCEICRLVLIEEMTNICSACGIVVCDEHAKICDDCESIFCSRHINSCDYSEDCEDDICHDCADDHLEAHEEEDEEEDEEEEDEEDEDEEDEEDIVFIDTKDRCKTCDSCLIFYDVVQEGFNGGQMVVCGNCHTVRWVPMSDFTQIGISRPRRMTREEFDKKLEEERGKDKKKSRVDCVIEEIPKWLGLRER